MDVQNLFTTKNESRITELAQYMVSPPRFEKILVSFIHSICSCEEFLITRDLAHIAENVIELLTFTQSRHFVMNISERLCLQHTDTFVYQVGLKFGIGAISVCRTQICFRWRGPAGDLAMKCCAPVLFW